MISELFFDKNQLNRLFPFYILVDNNLTIKSLGRSIKKLLSIQLQDNLIDHFKIKRPNTSVNKFDDLIALTDCLIIIECVKNGKIILRGQFEYLKQTEDILFLGSPWIDSAEKLKQNNLQINDFAYNDSTIDFLQILKTNEIGNNDLKDLVDTINYQRNELRKVNREVHDIALFPTQSPDPIIRINFDGDIIKNNPAAAGLDFFKVDDKVYRVDDFCKYIASIIDKTCSKWTIEAISENKTFSFVCVTMVDEKYINLYGRDITKEKENEKQLKDSLKEVADYRYAMDESSIVAITDHKGKITYVNDNFCKISKFSAEELIGKDHRIVNSGYHSKKFINNLWVTITNGDTWRGDIKNKAKDGTYYWVDTTIVPFLNDQGKPYQFIAIRRDITTKKEIEKKLEDQRKFYEDILNNMPADIAVFNNKHEYLFVNPKAIKDNDLREWIIGKTDYDYCTERNKPTLAADGRRKSFNTVIETKQPSEWEEKNVSLNGDVEYMLRRWFPVINEEGIIELVIGYGIDITERRKSEEALKINEEKYRNIITNMNLGMLEINLDRSISFANQTLANMVQTPIEELIGSSIDNFLSKESLDIVIAKLVERVKGKSEAFELKVSAKGIEKWWLVSSTPRFNSLGLVEGSIVICLDINNQKQLETDLRKSRAQAEALAKTKEIFLANMSHEIRTPMNAIIGMGNQLSKTQLSDQQKIYTNTINKASENLLVIINDILDLSKIEAGKLNIENIAFEPRQVINQVISVLGHKAEEKGIKLFYNLLGENLSDVLIGDPFRLNQILLNLISNSIKFTEKGSIEIVFLVVENTVTSQKIRISVVDTGIGMDAKFVERLFDKFSQEYESISRKYGGTGLGMSICKELVNLMGGEIKVTSKKKEGTVVEFEIIFDKGSIKDLSGNVTSSIKENFLNEKSILVVDDNEMNRFVARTILENYNATVFEAENGRLACDFAENNAVDLILMDIQMPEMNGFEATKIIRKSGNNVPIIALTANAIKGENEKCFSSGMNDIVTKPFKEEYLLNTIAKLISGAETAKDQVLNNLKEQFEDDKVLYDLTLLKELSRGNEEFIKKMINLFNDIAPETVVQIKESFEKNDIIKVKKLAHKLKPSIDNLGIFLLKENIRKIENFDIEKDSLQSLTEWIAFLEETTKNVVIDLKKEL